MPSGQAARLGALHRQQVIQGRPVSFSSDRLDSKCLRHVNQFVRALWHTLEQQSDFGDNKTHKFRYEEEDPSGGTI